MGIAMTSTFSRQVKTLHFSLQTLYTLHCTTPPGWLSRKPLYLIQLFRAKLSEKVQATIWKDIVVVLSSLFFKEIWKNGTKGHGHTPISKKVVEEKGEWQLSNGDCTTERNRGFWILMVNNHLSKLVNWCRLHLVTNLDGGLYAWFVHALKHSVPEASLFGGVSERTVERYISKFPVTGDVKSKTIGHSYEETRNVFSLKQKTRDSFFFGVKNPQTNVHSWCWYFHARGTQLICMEFCISNRETTVPFRRSFPFDINSSFAILSDNFFWNSCMFVSAKRKRQKVGSTATVSGRYINHIPCYLSGLSRAHVFPTTFLEIAVSIWC